MLFNKSSVNYAQFVRFVIGLNLIMIDFMYS